ncbi:MAG: hypothetical protein AAGF36_10035 [Pseudomonadota bacterium]
MSDETRTFNAATIEVDGVATEPMTVTVEVKVNDGKRQGFGGATVSQDVFDKIEGVDGQASVHTAGGDSFTIMIRKATEKTGEITFETSGPVPEGDG